MDQKFELTIRERTLIVFINKHMRPSVTKKLTSQKWHYISYRIIWQMNTYKTLPVLAMYKSMSSNSCVRTFSAFVALSNSAGQIVKRTANIKNGTLRKSNFIARNSPNFSLKLTMQCLKDFFIILHRFNEHRNWFSLTITTRNVAKN